MVSREQEQLRMIELMEVGVGMFERGALEEETVPAPTVHLVLMVSVVVDTRTRSNSFHLEAILLSTGVLFQANCLL